MKKLIYLSIALFGLYSCGTEDDSSYNINGTITGMEDQTVYLEKPDEKDITGVDSTESKDGTFSFTGKIDAPMQYYVTFENLDAEITFFNEASDITLTGDIDSLQKLAVKGSESQAVFEKYQQRLNQIREQQREIYYQYQEAKSANNEQEMALYEGQYMSLDSVRNEYSDKFIDEHPESPVSAFIAMRLSYTYDLQRLEEVVSNFDSTLEGSFYVQQLKDRIAKLRKTAVGEPAPDFTMDNPEGEPIDLSDFRGKYVLLDFWAAWCSPCRAENPNVVEAYQKYKDEGFTVFGVSLDNNKEDWLKAIEKDNLTWKHVSDLKGWDNAASNLYGVRSIPQNYLLDEEGVIVAKNLRGEELHEKLEEIFNQ